ncbi:MAG TPA: hypothetical protein ENJ95_11070 [Bacteroidetes bacterium]|nr:hypothetical protein [Bacteroidota bacterium]
MKKQSIFTAIFMAMFFFQANALCTWTGAVDDKWSEAGNWDCGHVPLMSDDVTIPDGSAITLDMSSTITKLTMMGGSITGPETLTVSDFLLWEKGTFDAGITAGSTLEMKTLGTKILKKLLTIGGSGVWDSGDIFIDDTGEMKVDGTFTAAFGGAIHFGSMTPGKLTIVGFFVIGTTGTVSVDVDLSNTSTGTINGTGVLAIGMAGSFTNAGTVAPGLSPGTLTMDGDYTNGSTLDIEVHKDLMGSPLNDLLIVGGTATLAGTLKVTETGAGTVPDGTYTLLTATSISGMFSSFDLPVGYTVSMTATEVTVTKAALPVELAYFSARQQNGNVLLNWETASETNNGFFEIERSTDGRRFEAIAKIPGQGNSSISHVYSFLDKNIPHRLNSDIIYYRLRQMDTGGSFEYSKIISIKLENNILFEIKNISQTGNGQLAIYFNNNEPAETQIYIFDFTGKMVLSKTIFLGSNENKYLLKPHYLPTGIYTAAANWNGKKYAGKFFWKD